MGILFFLTERYWSRKGCFFFDAHLWCQVSKALLQYFEISFIQYFTIFSCKQDDVIADLMCIIGKRQYL